MNIEIKPLNSNSIKTLRLLQASGEAITRARIADTLHLNSEEVASALSALAARGYKLVEGETGIQLPVSPETIFPWDVEEDISTQFMGHATRVFSEADSSNAIAMDWAKEGAPDGGVVVAEQQSAGRGRFTRNWSSPAERGIYFTLIVRPTELATTQVPMLTFLTAAAVAEALVEFTGIDAKVKWPNDVLVNGKKICGILAEAKMLKDHAEYVVIGTGINTNHGTEDFPPDCLTSATSVYLETGKKVFRAKLLQYILELMEDYYLHYVKEGFPWLQERWMKRNCTMGRFVKVNTNTEGIVEGTTVGLSELGGLLVKTADGEVREFFAGDVSIGSKNFQ